MKTKTFTREFLVNELDLPWAAKEETILDTTRWSIVKEIIFEYEGKNYLTTYSQGATECQDESPWEYDITVECIEVELKEVKLLKWVEVE